MAEATVATSRDDDPQPSASMHKVVGGMTDEWAFLSGFFHGPITKAKLACYHHKGRLHTDTVVCHVTKISRSFTGKPLWECVQEWQAESLEHLGHSQLFPPEWLKTKRSRRTAVREMYPQVPGQITEEDVRRWRALGILPDNEL